MPKLTCSRQRGAWSLSSFGTWSYLKHRNARSAAMCLRHWADRKGYWYDYKVLDKDELAFIVYGPDKPDKPVELEIS